MPVCRLSTFLARGPNLWDLVRVKRNRSDAFRFLVCLPKGEPHDAEFFTSEHHAVDVAYDWSVDNGGAPMVVQRDGVDWLEVIT